MLSYAKTKARLVYVWNTCNQKCCLSDGCCLEVFQCWGCSKSENFKGEIFRDCFVRRFARCAAGVRKVCPVGIKPTPKISPPAGQKGCLICWPWSDLVLDLVRFNIALYPLWLTRAFVPTALLSKWAANTHIHTHTLTHFGS